MNRELPETHEQRINRIVDHVKKIVRRALNNTVNPNKERASCTIVAVLDHVKNTGAINAWKINDVTVKRRSLHDDVRLSHDAVPGDPVYAEDGTYAGIVVAVSEPGRGRVLWNDPSSFPPTVECRVTLQPQRSVEYIMIDIKNG